MHFDKRLKDYLKQTRWNFIFSIGSGLFISLAIILQAYFLSQIIDRVFLKNHTLQQVLYLIYAFIASSGLRAIFIIIQKYYAANVSQQIKQTLRKKLADHLLRLGPVSLKNEKTGELVNTLTTGVDTLDAYFSQYLPQIFLAALIPLVILFVVFPLDILSGIVLLFTAPLIPLFMILIGSIAQTLTQKQWKALSRMSAYFLEVFQGLTTLKLFGRSREQIRIISKISDDFRHVTMKVLRVAFLSALTLEFIATLSTAIIAVEVGLRLLYWKMLFQQALFILILAPEFYLPMRLLGTHYHAGMEGVAAATRIFELLDKKSTVSVVTTSRQPDLRSISVALEGVSYTYPNSDEEVLKYIHLRIEPGETLALAGPSGSGKTTLSHLLLRFVEPTRGSIRINGFSLNEIDIRWWRRHVSWISQRPYLFYGSIAENLRLAKPEASLSEIEEAASRAKIHEFIRSLPQGYETPVGEKGVRLSGGQIQRLALARAFLKNAPFLILDEPTSNLDPQTENDLNRSLAMLLQNRTALIIAHRLSTLRKADRIIFLSRGQVVEEGAPERLLRQKGHYWKLVQTANQQIQVK